jgi:hypothetical protein
MWCWTDRNEQDRFTRKMPSKTSLTMPSKIDLQYAKQDFYGNCNKKCERSYGSRPMKHQVRIADSISVIGIGRNLTMRNATTDTTFGKLVVTGRIRLWILACHGLI